MKNPYLQVEHASTPPHLPYRPKTDPASWIFDALQAARAADSSSHVTDDVLHAVWIASWRAASMYAYNTIDKETLIRLYAQSPGYADCGATWAALIVGLMTASKARG